MSRFIAFVVRLVLVIDYIGFLIEHWGLNTATATQSIEICDLYDWSTHIMEGRFA